MTPMTPVMRKFVLHWGEMGSRWGVSRTVAQIHALLYLSTKPLPAETIAQALMVARSNVSTGLKELQNWRLIRVVHVMGDRRDHFESLEDVGEIFGHILAERKRREVDPVTNALRGCVAEATLADGPTAARLKDMLDHVEATSFLLEQVSTMPGSAILKLAKVGGKLDRLLTKSAEPHVTGLSAARVAEMSGV